MASTRNGSVVDRKYVLHRKLYNDMKETLTHEEFVDLKNLCRGRFFKAGQVERIKSVTDLLDALEKKNIIGIHTGYGELKKLLTDSGLEMDGLVNDIVRAEEEIEELNEGGCDEVFPVPEQRAHSSHHQSDSLRRRRISDPGNVPLNVKRQRLSRTESDADTEYVYATQPDSHNLLLIIDQFTQEREGGQVDFEALDDLFRNTIRFSDILPKKDLSKVEFQHALSEAAQLIRDSPFNFDRLFVAILGHGCENGIKTCASSTDWEHGQYMRPEDIIAPFKSVVLPKMAGKPKVFLIQACQGQGKMNGVRTDSEVGGRSRPPARDPSRPGRLTTDLGGATRPDDADFLICNSSTENYVSYRNTAEGSWFIRHLVEVFREKFRKDHVLDMMMEVNRRVAAEEAHTPDTAENKSTQSEVFQQGPKKQVPCQISTLTRKILLTSPIN